MGELKFKVGDKVMARFGKGWVKATVSRVAPDYTHCYICAGDKIPSGENVWFRERDVKARPSKRSNGTVTERLRRQVTEQAQEIEQLKALVRDGDEAREMNSALQTRLHESKEELKSVVSSYDKLLSAIQAERDAVAESAINSAKRLTVECDSNETLRGMLKDAQRGEKRAKRTVELIRVVLNMVGEE